MHIMISLPDSTSIMSAATLRNSAIKALTGSTILLYGSEISPKTLLLAQGVRAVGWPLIKDRVGDLAASFGRAKKVAEASYPEVKKNMAELKALERDLLALKKELEEGKITEANYKAKQDIIVKDITKAKKVISSLGNIFNHIKDAVDPQHVKDVLLQLYASAISCAATASSSVASSCAVGVNLGSMLTSRLQGFVKNNKKAIVTELTKGAKLAKGSPVSEIADSVLAEIQDDNFIDNALHVVGASVGLITSFFFRQVSHTIGSCALGAELLLTSIEDVLEPVFDKFNLPKEALHTKTGVLATLHGSLITLAVARALRGKAKPTGLAAVVLSPLQVIEGFNGKLFPK
jgi:hypothetical protein